MLFAIVMLILVIAGLVGFILLVYWAASRSLKRSAESAQLTADTQTDDVTVVGKRSDTSGAAGLVMHQQYYLTFEYSNGSRAEMSVPGEVYGMLVDGDRGTLISTGGAFDSFQRRSLR